MMVLRLHRGATARMTSTTRFKVAGRPKTERYKGSGEKKKRKKCPICLDFGHHWHTCKKGNLEDIAAMQAIRGSPKKKAKSAHSSIVPLEEDAPAASMSFPPRTWRKQPLPKKTNCDDCTPEVSRSQSLEISSKTKGKQKKNSSGLSKRSRSGSNQPETTAIEEVAKKVPKKIAKKVTKKVAKKGQGAKDVSISLVPLDSPSIGIRSKKTQPSSPAMSTRSKRRLSL
ncbi:hypothetical protein PVAP13_7NG437201 [Panicum virgatum]|uniref:Uncharacterized protein n=1 Tax=Panicum virgatum TaxID=38727 RepID=A0A8T0Q930_PANVG|nr:hypothetical protein PVAP13_7NG437201 [Panicum virgatum]